MQNIRCQVPAGGILAQHFAEVPSHLFYPALLFMKIIWGQSQMARLLALWNLAARSEPSPGQLWYDESMWHLWTGSLAACHQSFSQLALRFRGKFDLAPDEITALHCLVCMRNMLAHAALSPYAQASPAQDRSAPVVSFIPVQAKNKDCAKCPMFPDDVARGRALPFDEVALEGYLADVDTVTAALQRISAAMGLAYIDLQ